LLERVRDEADRRLKDYHDFADRFTEAAVVGVFTNNL
jgi:hypothetical protein